jgi:hypothetical protein
VLEVFFFFKSLNLLSSVNVALGGVYYNLIWYFSEGVLSAQDTLLSHAFETKDYGPPSLLLLILLFFDSLVAASRHWSYVSAVVLGVISLLGASPSPSHHLNLLKEQPASSSLQSLFNLSSRLVTI